MEQRKYNIGDRVFGIPDHYSGHSFINWTGYYIITSIKIVPENFIYNKLSGKHEPSKKERIEYYAKVSSIGHPEILLEYVFKDRAEFNEFITAYNFEDKYPYK